MRCSEPGPRVPVAIHASPDRIAELGLGLVSVAFLSYSGSTLDTQLLSYSGLGCGVWCLIEVACTFSNADRNVAVADLVLVWTLSVQARVGFVSARFVYTLISGR